MEREGQTVTLASILSESLFALNALVNYNGSTAYQAVYGRQPALLPELPSESELSNADGSSTEQQRMRVRTIAAEAIIQHTAMNKVNRSHAARTHDFSHFAPGQQVDWYRPPSSKDISGWSGPAEIVRVDFNEGQATIKHHGKEKRCRFQDLRHSLFILSLAVLPDGNLTWTPGKVIMEFMQSLPMQTVAFFGYTYSKDHTIAYAKNNAEHPRVYAALERMALKGFRVQNPIAFRLGRGVRRFGSFSLSSGCLIVYWPANEIDDVRMHISVEPDIEMKRFLDSPPFVLEHSNHLSR